jgi:hypothetical protein
VTFLRHPQYGAHFSNVSVDSYNVYEGRECSDHAFMLRGVSGNAPKKFMMVRKIHRENDRTSEDPSLSGNEAQDIFGGDLQRCK